MVTVALGALRKGLRAAGVDTGDRISAGEARRLACEAGIIPMVLDGDPMPLDLGREQHLFKKQQEIALAHRYGGCSTDGCDRPLSWVEIHHLVPWRHGGRTDLSNGLLLCSGGNRPLPSADVSPGGERGVAARRCSCAPRKRSPPRVRWRRQ